MVLRATHMHRAGPESLSRMQMGHSFSGCGQALMHLGGRDPNRYQECAKDSPWGPESQTRMGSPAEGPLPRVPRSRPDVLRSPARTLALPHLALPYPPSPRSQGAS